MEMRKMFFAPLMALCLVATLFTACGGKDKDSKTANQEKKATVMADTAVLSNLKDFASRPRPRGNFGFYVYDLTADKPLYGVNQRSAQSSASCLKLLTGVAGLHLLGTNYMYATDVYMRGNIVGDTLKGDVTFKAGLDPTINEPELRYFAQAVRKRGVKKIDGRLILDLVLREPVKSEPHWYPWDLSFSKYGIFYKGSDKLARKLREAFNAAGVQVSDKQVVEGRVPQGSRCIFRFKRSIRRVIKRMWKNSSNTQATALLYTIGHRLSPHGNYTEAGVNYLRKFLKEDLGEKNSTLVLHDGCGLCTYNHLSPEALVSVLRYGYQHKDIYRLLYENLSIAGVDGTLHGEMTSEKTRGKIRAKTGTLSHPYGISSLAGYCQSASGHLLAFSIMDTDMSVLDARVLQRKLCEALVK